MIPKIIHYCWFGRNPKPESALKCIESWKKYCPDYEIREWTEKEFDISQNLYCKQAYDMKKWAFATDYARLVIVYNNGGVYLDTDVEIVRPIDELLNYNFFIGRQPGFQVNTGSGFGAVKGHPALKRMLDDYADIPFIKEDGEPDLLTCPHRNSQWLFEKGLRRDDSLQTIEDVTVFPIEYFSPLDAWTRSLKVTENTYSIHHCDATWNENETKKEHKRRAREYKNACFKDAVIHVPNRILKFLLGKERYDKLKNNLKNK